jgi:hypothetical protein
MPPPELYLALRERNNQESLARLLRGLRSAPATMVTQLRFESQPIVREAVAHCDENDYLEAMHQLDLHYDDLHYDPTCSPRSRCGEHGWLDGIGMKASSFQCVCKKQNLPNVHAYPVTRK